MVTRGRPKKNPETLSDSIVSVRLNGEDREGLDELVARMNAEVAHAGVTVTPGHLLRALLRREIQDKLSRKVQPEKTPEKPGKRGKS